VNFNIDNEIEVPQKSSIMPYIWATVIMFLIASLLVLGILILRPNADPLLVIGGIFGVVGTMTASILAVMKAQETHLSVNSRLDAWKRSMRTEARREGGDIERDRVAKLSPPAPAAAADLSLRITAQQPEATATEPRKDQDKNA
jgi:hypothetical protein